MDTGDLVNLWSSVGATILLGTWWGSRRPVGIGPAAVGPVARHLSVLHHRAFRLTTIAIAIAVGAFWPVAGTVLATILMLHEVQLHRARSATEAIPRFRPSPHMMACAVLPPGVYLFGMWLVDPGMQVMVRIAVDEPWLAAMGVLVHSFLPILLAAYIPCVFVAAVLPWRRSIRPWQALTSSHGWRTVLPVLGVFGVAASALVLTARWQEQSITGPIFEVFDRSPGRRFVDDIRRGETPLPETDVGRSAAVVAGIWLADKDPSFDLETLGRRYRKTFSRFHAPLWPTLVQYTLVTMLAERALQRNPGHRAASEIAASVIATAYPAYELARILPSATELARLFLPDRRLEDRRREYLSAARLDHYLEQPGGAALLATWTRLRAALGEATPAEPLRQQARSVLDSFLNTGVTGDALGRVGTQWSYPRVIPTVRRDDGTLYEGFGALLLDTQRPQATLTINAVPEWVLAESVLAVVLMEQLTERLTERLGEPHRSNLSGYRDRMRALCIARPKGERSNFDLSFAPLGWHLAEVVGKLERVPWWRPIVDAQMFLAAMLCLGFTLGALWSSMRLTPRR